MYLERVRYWINKLPWKAGFFVTIGLLFMGWILSTPPGIMGKADAIGYAVCHRIDGRSFHIGDRQLPMCVRCSGMFLGAFLGLVFQGFTGRRRMGAPPVKIILFLVVLVIAFGVDGVNSYLHFFPKAPSLYEPQHWLRLITGTGMGLVVAVMLFPAFNQTVWVDSDNRPAMPGLRNFLGLLLVAAGLDGLILTESWVILYPLAIISSGSVLILLTMVYSMILLMVFRWENRIARWREMAVPLAGGFFLALAQIAMFDFVRYFFTKTWGGFPLLG